MALQPSMQQTCLSAGWYHSLVVVEDHECHTIGHTYHGATSQSAEFRDTVQAVAAGGVHDIALLKDRSCWTWGENGSGQLGDGSTTSESTPFKVPIDGAIAVAAGACHTLAVLEDGSCWAWGANGHGQLGDGTTDQRSSPVRAVFPPVVFPRKVKAVAAGEAHSLAILEDGECWEWGRTTISARNDAPQSGEGATSSNESKAVGKPSKVNLTGEVFRIAAGGSHSLAVTDNAVYDERADLWMFDDCRVRPARIGFVRSQRCE